MARGGLVRLTANSAVIESGQPIRVYDMHIVSSNTPGIVTLRNGTSTAATAVLAETGASLEGKTFVYGESGRYFPAGCFADLDANVSYASLTAELVR